MALPKLFQRIFWHNNTTPAINEDNLNAMSKGLSDVDDRLIDLAGTIMEDVPQIQEDLEILEPAIENIDSNVERAETAADDAEGSADEAEYWANVSNPPIPVTKDFASVITVDDAIPKAATDVKVKVEAVQDLHGYTKPWVGGAGKNLIPLTVAKIKSANSGTWSGNSFSKNSLTFTILTDSAENVTGIKVSGTGSAETSFYIVFGSGQIPVGDYYANGSANGGGINTFDVYFWNNTQGARVKQWDGTTNSISLDSGSVNAQIKIPNTTDNLYYVIRVKAGWNTNGMIFYPMIRLSTVSDSTFEPYTNICPISGFTEAKVTRTGKNLFDKSSTDYVTGFIDTVNQNIALQSGYSIAYIKCKPNTTYTISKVAGKSFRICTTKDEPAGGVAYISTFANHTATSMTVTTESNANYIAVMYYSQFNGDTLTPEQIAATLQIEIGSNATPYEPYNGTDYIIDLDGTRYGATLDVDSGQLMVDRALVEFDGSNDENWDMSSGTNVNAWHQFYLTKGDAKDSLNMQTNKFQLINIGDRGQKTGAISYNDKTMRFALVDKEVLITSVTDWKAWLASSPLEVIYELATPITVQLTPTEVQMLQGYNVLSANSGDVYLKYDASMIQRIANEKLDISTFKSVVASSSDFADFKTKVAAL